MEALGHKRNQGLCQFHNQNQSDVFGNLRTGKYQKRMGFGTKIVI